MTFSKIIAPTQEIFSECTFSLGRTQKNDGKTTVGRHNYIQTFSAKKAIFRYTCCKTRRLKETSGPGSTLER